MLAVCLTMCMVAPGPSPDERRGIEGVVIEDVKAFGIAPADVRKNFYAANGNATDELRWTIRYNNSPEVVMQWEEDCKYRRVCWDLLDDVVYCTFLIEAKKLRSLGRLRELLGDDDYFAGRMPNPTPYYKTPLK